MHRFKHLIAFCLSLFAVLSTNSWAQQFPNKAITIVVPFPPGGTTDVLARVLSERMSRELNQPVLVDNRAGAGGNTGALAVARAAADGYTLLLSSAGPLSINHTLYPNAGYDPVKNFAPVSHLADVPIMLVANMNAPFKTVPEMLEYAKANPGKLFYGSQGNGTTSHLTMELLKHSSGVPIEHVPYRGSAPAAADLMGGAVQLMFDNSPTTLPQVKANRMRALAVASKARVKGMNDIPALSETIKGFESVAWFGLVAPAGTPPAVVAQLNEVVNRILAQKDVQERFAASGVQLVGGTPKEFGDFIGREISKWTQIIRTAKVKVD